MDRRSFKNFITSRSSMWTISLCMTGAIVLGGIAAVDQVRKQEKEPLEQELGDMAYLDETGDKLFDTLEDLPENENVAANADGSTDYGNDWILKEQTADDENRTADDAGNTMDEQVSDESTDGTAAAENTAAVSVEGEAVEGVSAGAEGEAEAAVSAGILSEQVLLEHGIRFDADTSLIWPAAGTILIDYSMDSSVYFPTLNQYKYNPALVIGSETGNQVLASAKGMVESVEIDEETGTTLVMNIGDGYRLTYGQLKELAVGQGDVVEAGSVIGYVSEPTKYYSTEGSNLYFKMTKDETPVDPVLYLE